MASLASINIRFRADLKEFSSQLQNAQRQLDKAGKNMQRTGKALSAAVTLPFVALAGVSLVNFDKQAQSIAQVEAGLKSTGNAAGFTSKQLQDMASELQQTTLFDDDDILQNATAQLLTFTNLAGTQFERTQQAALNLATRLDGDLKSASIQLGKALNDPVANLSALSRSGIQFSKEQKATIDALVNTNQLAEAQTIILDELEKQYGGSAAAAAKAGTGPLRQLGNILGDVSEEFGKIIFEGIAPFIDKLKGIVIAFRDLSPTTKKWIVILGGIAAAVGPLLALAGTILPAIGTGLALLTGPIGLIIAGLTAVGIIIYKNWAPIKRTLIDIANYFIDLYNESTLFRVGVQAVVKVFKDLFEIGKFVFETLKNIIGGFIDNFVNGFKTIGKIIKAVFTGDLGSIPDILAAAAKEGTNTFFEFTNELGNDWKNLTDGIEENTQNAIEAITTRNKIAFIKENVDASAVEEAVGEAVANGLKTGGAGGVSTDQAKLNKITQEVDLGDIETIDLGTLVNFDQAEIAAKGELFASAVNDAIDIDLDTSAIDNYTSNFASNAERLRELGLVIPQTFLDAFGETNSDLLFLAGENFTTYVDGVVEQATRVQETMNLIGEGVANVFGNLATSMVESLGLAETGMEGFVKNILKLSIDLITQLIQNAIKNIAVRQAESVANAIAGATASGAATGPAAIFSTPAFIATAIAGVLSAFAAIPKFATGGIVGGSSYYGDKILARLNSGELVLDQAKQKSLYNALTGGPNSNITITGVLRGEGRDLISVIDKTNVQLSRTR